MTTEFTSLNLRPELEQAIIDLGYLRQPLFKKA